MRINDLVTRTKYGHDIVFKIIKIEKNIAYLQGEVLRLFADAEISDLRPSNGGDKIYDIPTFDNLKTSGFMNGKILHIDGDEYYLKKAMAYYKDANISCIGYYLKEEEMPLNILGLLRKHNPDILVITGHDSYDGKELRNLSSYRTSKYFVEAINVARNYQNSKDALAIIAGACQSNFEGLINAGANFASSPKRENIHLLDPVILAINLAVTSIDENVNPEIFINQTITKSIGGIQTKGFGRRIYLGGKTYVNRSERKN